MYLSMRGNLDLLGRCLGDLLATLQILDLESVLSLLSIFSLVNLFRQTCEVESTRTREQDFGMLQVRNPSPPGVNHFESFKESETRSFLQHVNF